MSFLSGLGKILGVAGGAVAAPFTGGASLSALPAILGAGGAAVGAMSNAAAQNRGAAFGGQLDLASILAQRDAQLQNLRAQADNDYTANQIARENSGMATRDDAWRKLLSAQHTISPAAMPNVSPYAMAQRQPTGAERQGADALTAEVLARLQGGNQVAPVERRNPAFDYDPMSTINPGLLKPGGLERLGGVLAPVLAAGGAIAGARQPSRMPTLGTPGAPILSPSDLAWLRTINPAMAG